MSEPVRHPNLRRCDRAVIVGRYVLCAFFALSIFGFAFAKREFAPMGLMSYAVYAVMSGTALALLAFSVYLRARQRAIFYLLYFLCLGVVIAAPHPADTLIRDVEHIHRGMPMDETRTLIAPHIARGDLKINGSMTKWPLKSGTGSQWYSTPLTTSIDYVAVEFHDGKVESASIGWD